MYSVKMGANGDDINNKLMLLTSRNTGDTNDSIDNGNNSSIDNDDDDMKVIMNNSSSSNYSNDLGKNNKDIIYDDNFHDDTSYNIGYCISLHTLLYTSKN